MITSKTFLYLLNALLCMCFEWSFLKNVKYLKNLNDLSLMNMKNTCEIHKKF